jgi:hypothetical protein
MQNPIGDAIRARTATAASTDAQFEAHIKAFLAKREAEQKVRASVDTEKLRRASIQGGALFSMCKRVEPYIVASSVNIGTAAARANSIEAGLAFFYKIKEQQEKEKQQQQQQQSQS